jgi:hypothetical protein
MKRLTPPLPERTDTRSGTTASPEESCANAIFIASMAAGIPMQRRTSAAVRILSCMLHRSRRLLNECSGPPPLAALNSPVVSKQTTTS